MIAVLWDLDDTLVNTVAARMRSLEYAYEECLGGHVDGYTLWRSHRGGTLETLAWQLMGEDFRRFTDAYRRHYFEERAPVACYPEIPGVLEHLVVTGTPMAVVTSKISWGATEELQECDLLQYFQSVVGYDDTDAHKPDPDPIYEAMDRLTLDPGTSVYFVGDSPADIHAARNAGCQSIGALWGTMEEQLLRDAEPDFVVTRPADVLDIVHPGADE